MPRIRFQAAMRVIGVLCLFGIWMQIMLSSGRSGLDQNTDELMNLNETSEQVLSRVPPELHKYLTVQPRNYSGNWSEPRITNISEIRRAIEQHNAAQVIYNEDIFGPVQNDTIIVAIQVHLRLTYLRHLVVSLALARGVQRALLVFSHDHYDHQLNQLVKTIDFTKVMQIFYPYSIQTHPHRFPGVDPRDCPRDANKQKAIKLGCTNAQHPDVHGHYREAPYTQTKHHWWWKTNAIFNGLRATKYHTGPVIFLEEDHYVSEDFFVMLEKVRDAADRDCPQCSFLGLGSYLKTYQYHVTSNVLEITPWHSSLHNMGFAFNRSVWEEIVSLQKEFCSYDDYNWDYSLLHLSQNRKGKEPFRVLLAKGPRVFHIGECGIHHRKSDCNASTVISKVQKLLASVRKYLFPRDVKVVTARITNKHRKKMGKGNGGWGDVRDHELCTNMTYISREYNSLDFGPLT